MARIAPLTAIPRCRCSGTCATTCAHRHEIRLRHGLCGACTVHLNGEAVRSCVHRMDAPRARTSSPSKALPRPRLHPVQKAWIELNVPQCGYCQAGQIMQAVALLNSKTKPTDQDIDQAMSGNICRCGTYQRIRAAIKSAAKETA